METCPSCGAGIEDAFCAACGERRPSARIYTIGDFASEAFEAFTNVERSFLRTFWTLIRKPGELTAAYMRGRRVAYLKPLQLFLLVNLLFFIFAGWLQARVFTTTLNNHLNSPYGALARDLTAGRVDASGMEMAEYRKAFDLKVEVLSRSLLIVIAPVIGAIMALLYARRRRPAVMHLVFGTHFLTGMLLLISGVVIALHAIDLPFRLAGRRLTEQTHESLAGYLLLVGTLWFLYRSLRGAYDDSRGPAAIRTVIGVVFLVYVMIGYRLLLFLVTSYSL